MEQTTLSITGAGELGDLSQWSVNAQATPVHPGASAAGAGSFSATVGADPEFDFAIAEEYTLADQTAGFLTGNLTNVSRSGASVQITGDTALSKLAADRTMPPGGTVPGELIQSVPQAIPGFNYGDQAPNMETGDVYVKTDNGAYVFRYDSAGNYIGFWGSEGSGNGQFNTSHPNWDNTSLCVVPGGNVYVVDPGNNRVQWFSPTGAYLGQFSVTNPRFLYYYRGFLYLTQAYEFGVNEATLARYTLTGGSRTVLVPSGPLGGFSMTYLAFTPEYIYIYGENFARWTRYVVATNTVEPYREGESTEGRGYHGTQQINENTIMAVWITSNPRSLNVGIAAVGPLTNSSFTPVFTIPNQLIVSRGFAVTSEGDYFKFGTTFTNRVDVFATSLPNYRLSRLIQNYVNKTVSGIAVDYQATNDPYVSAVGWKDSVWTKLNQLCVAYGIEMSLSGGVIVVRDVGSVDLEVEDTTERSLTINNTQTAQYVTIPYNNARTGADEVYDAAKDNNRVIEAAAWTETIEYIQTPHSPITLVQPQATTTLPVPRNSFYVIASDNVRVMPAQFASYGGRVEVSVDSTQVGTIRVRFRAPGAIPGVPGPYRLSVSDGTNTYGGLRIDGTGVFVRNEEERIFTGAAPDISTTEDAGSALSNPFIATRAQAYSRGSFATRRLAGPNLSLSLTISNKDALGFGLTEGALFRYRDNRWRIVTTTSSRAGVQITAEPYVVVGDVEALWSSVAGFQDFWDGKKVKDGNVRPLAS